MSNSYLHTLAFQQQSPKVFPPPDFQQPSINTLWEEEVYRNGGKATRIQINEIDGETMVGLGNWFFNISTQEWRANKGQVNMSVLAWHNLENLQKTIHQHLEIFEPNTHQESDDTEASKNLLLLFSIY